MAVTNAQIKAELEYIKADVATIKTGIYGNGTKGMKARVAILETKFIILFGLLTPIAVWAARDMIWG